MAKMTRREFLQYLAVGAGGASLSQLLGACGRGMETLIPTATGGPVEASPTDTRKIPSTAQPETATDTAEHVETEALSATETRPKATDTPQGSPDMVVAHGGDPEEIVRLALSALGGMGHYVANGADVIIKPNICHAYYTYEYATTTNPWVVGALVKLCLEAGAERVRVMDYPFGGTQEQAYVKTGIQEQVQAAGGEMAFMPGFQYISKDIPDGRDIRSVEIFDDILTADVLIDVPIAKHHSLAGLTLGMKNLLGVIKDRAAMHRNLGQRLADLTSLAYPTLTVVDAVRMLMDHGPTGGNLDDVKQMDTVIVSTDIVAADSYAATLFGMQPRDLSAVAAGADMGLGTSNLDELRIEQVNASV